MMGITDYLKLRGDVKISNLSFGGDGENKVLKNINIHANRDKE